MNIKTTDTKHADCESSQAWSHQLSQTTANKVIGLQLISTILVASAFAISGLTASLSAVYGGLTSVSTALLLNWSVRQANRNALTDPKKSMMMLYIGAVQRFVAVIVLLGIGIGALKLQPIPVIAGFAVARLAFLVSSRGVKQ